MTVTISSPLLEAKIAELGAELVHLRDEAGRELLSDGNPAFWTGRSPLLFPIVGKLPNDRYELDRQSYELNQHGFARTSVFELIDATEATCRFRLSGSKETLKHYPFMFKLDVAYRIQAATLAIEVSACSIGDKAMPVSFGFHPALRWPLPYGGARDEHEIRFERDEPAPLRTLSDGLIGRGERASPVEGDRLNLYDDLFQDGALIFDQHASRKVHYGVPGRRSVTIAFPDMPHLGIWTKPGAGFVCIEPWQGYATPVDFEGGFAEKPGMVSIPPGETRSFGMQITVDPAR